jgi:hypothetical protein
MQEIFSKKTEKRIIYENDGKVDHRSRGYGGGGFYLPI